MAINAWNIEVQGNKELAFIKHMELTLDLREHAKQ